MANDASEQGAKLAGWGNVSALDSLGCFFWLSVKVPIKSDVDTLS